ncbi:1-acyl-sn-glycerol-3-phosphate acyltransferase 1 [Nymphaea thermarum]|nr:1-acyl-sn-glycerol-3-phosphate acyltransferase 1 [Nymphaea thermarum]
MATICGPYFSCRDFVLVPSSLKNIAISLKSPHFHARPIFPGFQRGKSSGNSGLSCVLRHRDSASVNYCFPHTRVSRYTNRQCAAKAELSGTGISASSSSVNFSTDVSFYSRMRGICFYIVTGVVAIPLFLLMAVVHPLVLLFDRYRRRFHHLVAKIWASASIYCFCKIEFEGLENLPAPDLPAVYVSNHQSFLDIYTLLTLGRTFKFISKRGIFLIPVIGWAMFIMGLIQLRRMDNKSQLECLKRCIDIVKKGASVFFFPEGTRSKDGRLGPFKKGAFSVAAKTGAPVVPISLMGTGKMMPSGKEAILNSGSIRVIIHESLMGNNADELCSRARDVIAQGLVLHGYGLQ